MRAWLLLFALLPALAAAGKPPAGKFSNSECVGCHAQRDAALIAAWRASSHARTAPKADCIACHGNSHAGSNARARHDEVCIDCHEKLNRAVVHSYTTSKHAVIVKLQGNAWDWSQPLARGNYRAPGCAYCHLHGAEHDTRLSTTPWDPFQTSVASAQETTLSRRQSVCGDCHAPRYVAEQTGTGERMQKIARMKLREARAAMTDYQGVLSADDRRTIETLFAGMQEHGRNVRLGVGHQSPDYQWWHGQPALDGDLLRIKGVIAERERRVLVERARSAANGGAKPGQP